MVQDGLQMIGLQFQWEHFIAIVIEADRPNQRRRSAHDTESASLTADLQEKLESCFEEQGYVYAIHEVEPGRLGAIINFTAEAQRDVDNIYYMCLGLKERIAKESGYTVTIGIGRPADDALQIKNSYREAVKALQQKLVFGKNNVISIYDADKSTDEASGLTKDYIDYIVKHLKSSNMTLCIGKTNEAIDLLVAGKTDSGKLYKFFYSLVNLITFTVSEMGCSTEAVFGSDIDPVDDFLKNEDIADIKAWFSTVFGRIEEVMEQKNNKIPHDLIEKVKEYAYKHYSANISIGDVAEKVYLHPHYLGKLFKKVEGITWNEYLNQVRMDKAKELLLQTTMKVSDISIAVGVGSPQYFIYCFKNAYGITPKKMRESRFIQGTDETDA
jgi:two-component system response regulator YesN